MSTLSFFGSILLGYAMLAGVWIQAAETNSGVVTDLGPYIRTPPPPHTPRINGADIYGARAGHPFLFAIPATGDRPMKFEAHSLPDGLNLDNATGLITGTVNREGTYSVVCTAINSLGKDERKIDIVIGQKLCLTPPLGWNAWNCFRGNVDTARIKSVGDALQSRGLAQHGWSYVNIDDGWEPKQRDAQGYLTPDPKRFPDMKQLSDYLHGEGLKLGIYSSPGPTTCGGNLGSFGYEQLDAAAYGSWGIDYLKYDWCSYQSKYLVQVEELYAQALPENADELRSLGREQAELEDKWWGRIKGFKREDLKARVQAVKKRLDELHGLLDRDRANKIEIEAQQKPYIEMRAALDKVDRDIVYSLCQYGRADVWQWGAQIRADLWRTTDDLHEQWNLISRAFEQKDLQKWNTPGGWNDPDMLVVGLGNLTPDENYAHMTLWCILGAPLLIGCDVIKMSDFTQSLLTNDEVLAVDQDRLGIQGFPIKKDGFLEVWEKPLADGSVAVAFFNRGETEASVSVSCNDLQLIGPQEVQDLWREKDLGAYDTQYACHVAAHGAELFKFTQKK